MRLVEAACLGLVLAGLASGCGTHRSVLDEGVQLGPHRGVHRIGPTEAMAAARSGVHEWEHEIARRAHVSPKQRFRNVAAATFRHRLAALSRRHEFDVIAVELRRPRQLAPLVVVRTKRYVELAHAMPAILRQLDPKLRTGDDRTGWRYEGFFFEAVDEHGVPFLTVFNFMRGPGPGGGQWARSERLYPFDHG